MTHPDSGASGLRRRRGGAWAAVCISGLLLPAMAGAQSCPVPQAELDAVWQSAYEAYERRDCVRFVQAAGRYYGLVHHSGLSWDTREIGRAQEHCLGVLDSALRDADRLRQENAELRQRLAGGGDVRSGSFGLATWPPLSGRAPHAVP